jgi:DNA repair exonuclease SbcCD ATPase subunit
MFTAFYCFYIFLPLAFTFFTARHFAPKSSCMMTHKSNSKTATKLNTESATLPYLLAQPPQLRNSTGPLERDKLNGGEDINLGQEIAALQAKIESIENVLANFDEDEWKEKLVEIKNMTSEQKKDDPWVKWRSYDLDELKQRREKLEQRRENLEQLSENLRKEKMNLMAQKVQLSLARSAPGTITNCVCRIEYAKLSTYMC